MSEDSGLADSRGETRDYVQPTASSRGWVLAPNVVPSRLKQMGIGVERGIKQAIALFFSPGNEIGEQGHPVA